MRKSGTEGAYGAMAGSRACTGGGCRRLLLVPRYLLRRHSEQRVPGTNSARSPTASPVLAYRFSSTDLQHHPTSRARQLPPLIASGPRKGSSFPTRWLRGARYLPGLGVRSLLLT